MRLRVVIPLLSCLTIQLLAVSNSAAPDEVSATFLRTYAPTTMAPLGGMVYDVQYGANDHAYVRRGLHHALMEAS